MVENKSARSGAIYLFNSFNGITVDKLSTVAPRSSVTLHVDLKPGHYTWGCHLDGEGARQSVDVTVPRCRESRTRATGTDVDC